MQSKILLKINWKVSRCGIAEMKARVILLTWVNIPAWVNVILVKMHNQESYFPMKWGPKWNRGNTREIKFWFIWALHIILWNVFIAMFCYCWFSKRYMSTEIVPFKEGRYTWIKKQKPQNVGTLVPTSRRRLRGVPTWFFSSRWLKDWEVRPLRKIKGLSREAKAEEQCNALESWVSRFWLAVIGDNTSKNFLC